jgi:RNA polymerase sigma-70 factor, ECF subfamily
MTDEELLESYRRGDLGAVGLFFQRYGRPLYLYAFSMTSDRAQAEDVVQQAFVRLLERDPRAIDSVRGLLYAIAGNLVRDDLRRAAVSRRTWPVLAFTRAEEPGDREHAETLSRALSELPAEQREVVILKIHADLTFAAIAAALGVPEATAKSRYRYALEKLGELLRESKEVG